MSLRDARDRRRGPALPRGGRRGRWARAVWRHLRAVAGPPGGAPVLNEQIRHLAEPLKGKAKVLEG